MHQLKSEPKLQERLRLRYKLKLQIRIGPQGSRARNIQHLIAWLWSHERPRLPMQLLFGNRGSLGRLVPEVFICYQGRAHGWRKNNQHPNDMPRPDRSWEMDHGNKEDAQLLKKQTRRSHPLPTCTKSSPCSKRVIFSTKQKKIQIQ